MMEGYAPRAVRLPFAVCLLVAVGALLAVAGWRTAAPAAAHDASPPALASLAVTPPQVTTDEPSEQLDRAVLAIEDNDIALGLQLLQPLMREHPMASSEAHGPVGYWFGRAMADWGREEQALRIWDATLRIADGQDRPALTVADAIIRQAGAPTEDGDADPGQAAPQKDHTELLARAVAHLSANIDRAETEQGKAVAVQHGKLIRLLLTDDLRDALRCRDGYGCTLASSGARDLYAWWQQHDPVLDTDLNERMVEHARRVAYALTHYGWDTPDIGMDDRGTTYVRYGPPARSAALPVGDVAASGVVAEMGGASASLAPSPGEPGDQSGGSMIPGAPEAEQNSVLYELMKQGRRVEDLLLPGEAWVYPQHGESAVFIFHDPRGSGNRMQLGTAVDLLEPRLRNGAGMPSARGGSFVNTGVALSILNGLFDWLIREVDMSYTTSYGALQHAHLAASPSSAPVGQRLMRFINEEEVDGRARVRRRDKEVPAQGSSVRPPHLPAVPVDYRTARFLNEDGTTRTEVYWQMTRRAEISEKLASVLQAAGTSVSDRHAVEVTSAQFNSDYTDRQTRQSVFLTDEVDARNADAETPWIVVDRSTDLLHVGLQWKQYDVQETRGGDVIAGTIIGETRVMIDSIRTLPNDPSRLLMSDLRLIRVIDGEPMVPTSDEQARRRTIATQHLTPGETVLINYDVYNLRFSDDDQTRYSVDLQLQRTADRGGIRGWFGGQEESATATRSEYRGTTTRSDEYLTIDVPEVDRRTTVQVRVKVTDEVTGDTMQRTLDFIVDPEA
jgi:GWxTD domain-containing protein